MCKLAGWSSIPSRRLPRHIADEAIQTAHEEIRITERDGFGFAQPGTFIGRFQDPAHFHGIDALPDLYRRAGSTSAARAFKVTQTSQQGGVYAPVAPMLIHGRTATGKVSLDNTHPFRMGGWTLAHNGVVTWRGAMRGAHKKVTCDSQHILIALTSGRQAKAQLRKLSGYAAFLAFAPDGRMIVARDGTARLSAVVLPNGRWVFGTTAKIAEAVASCFTQKPVTAFELEDFTWLEFRPGEAEPRVSSWEMSGVTEAESKHAVRSLGFATTPATPTPATPTPATPTPTPATPTPTPATREKIPLLGQEGVNEFRWCPPSSGTGSYKKVYLNSICYVFDSAGERFPEAAAEQTVYVDVNKVRWERCSGGRQGWQCVRLTSDPATLNS